MGQRVKRRVFWHALIGAAVLGISPVAARAQQVYVGSGNGWTHLSEHPDQWTYVQKNADGFYINFIELLHADAATCAKLSALFVHKNAYYESDSRNTGLGGFPDGGQFSRALQAKELSYLLDGGFTVPYTSLNYGVDTDKLGDLKHLGLPKGQTRPCYTQCGPWTYGGDIMGNIGSAPKIRANIAITDGASTDGPLSLWQADQGKMQSGSYSLVKYVHSLHKTAVVMVAPYNLKPVSKWLSAAQECVRQHEDAGAKPEIWAVFEYATNTPALPETTADGQPANTTTGMAYWLIHHIKDPDHSARLEVSPSEASPIRAASFRASTDRTLTLTVRNTSTWLDLCPVLFAHIADPGNNWNVRFRMNGEDVTRQMTEGDGLPFIANRRLWPGDARQVDVVLEPRNPAVSAPEPTIQIGLRPNPSARDRVNQGVTLSPSPMRPTADQVASR